MSGRVAWRHAIWFSTVGQTGIGELMGWKEYDTGITGGTDPREAIDRASRGGIYLTKARMKAGKKSLLLES